MSSTLTINANLASLNAQRRLGNSTQALQQSFGRLSSGLRINKASDDAAGLAIASSLNADSRVYTQGIRSLHDGASAYSIAEGAVNQLANVVTRIRELAEQASNGTLGHSQRGANNAEAAALVSEYNRIVSTTSFNGQNLIDGTLSTLSIQNGYGQNGSLGLSIGQGLQRNVGDGTFQARVSYVTGGNPTMVTGADVNGDGILDVISADNASANVTVLVGNGNGTFKAGVAYAATSFNPNSAIAADLNSDGRLDLMVVANDGTANVLFGNGDGSFRARVSYVTGPSASRGILADVNGDGLTDVVTVDSSGPVTNVLLGNGDGSFRARRSFATGTLPNTVAAADLNGDGRADLIVGDTSNSTVSILLGNGDGTFRARTSLVNVPNVSQVLSADVNGDGYADVVAAGLGYVDIFLGNGDGTFPAGSSITAGNLYSVSGTDINGDGRIDLITGDSATNTVNMLIGNGDGSFKAAVSFASGTNPNWVTAADVNGDGRSDILSVNTNLSGTISVLLGNGGTSSFLPILNLNSQASALSVLDQMQTALSRITSELGSEGAAESRLQIATSNLQQMRENFDRAASQIMDVDVATEAANLAKNNILQQAGAAILAQANQQPALALRLLQGVR